MADGIHDLSDILVRVNGVEKLCCVMVIIGVRPPYFHKLLRINSSFEIG